MSAKSVTTTNIRSEVPLMRASFVESNPVPIKQVLSMLGHCGSGLRAPLGPPASATLDRLREALGLAGLNRVRT